MAVDKAAAWSFKELQCPSPCVVSSPAEECRLRRLGGVDMQKNGKIISSLQSEMQINFWWIHKESSLLAFSLVSREAVTLLNYFSHKTACIFPTVDLWLCCEDEKIWREDPFFQ